MRPDGYGDGYGCDVLQVDARAPLTMRSKFPGRCRTCNQKIRIGDPIEWRKGWGAVHDGCGFC